MSRWTVMLYLTGLDDLEPHMARTLLELERMGPWPGVEVILQLARAPHFTLSSILPEREATGIDGDWHGVRRYRLRARPAGFDEGTFCSELLCDLGEQSISDPRQLADFISYAQAHFPSERSMLVISGHGMGFVGLALDLVTGPAPTLMSLRGMAAALRSVKKRPEILILDACQMNSLETACELALPRPVAKWLVTPASHAPRAGLDYVALLTALYREAQAPDQQVAALVAQAVEPSAHVQVLVFSLNPDRWRAVAVAARNATEATYPPMFIEAAKACVYPSEGSRLRLLVHWPPSIHFPERFHYLYRRLRFVRLSGWSRLLPEVAREGVAKEGMGPLLTPSPLLFVWLRLLRTDLADHEVEELLVALGWANQ